MEQLRPQIGIAIIVYEALEKGMDPLRGDRIAEIADRLEGDVFPRYTFGAYDTGVGMRSRVVDETLGTYRQFGYSESMFRAAMTPQGKEVLGRVINEAEQENPRSVRTVRKIVTRLLKKMN